MKTFVLMIVVLILSSCGFGEIEVGTHSGSNGIWYGPSYGKHLSGTCYAVGIDYPEGYDWKADPDKGNVKCRLVMFADGEPVLKIPVGDMYEVSTDNSRHRLRSGHLYTDYTDGKTTVIKKDGTELLRYGFSEEVMSLVDHEGRIHTLGYPKDGDGFIYRVDGEVLVERPSGTVLNPLFIYDGKVCFCFSQYSESSTGQVLKYYLSENGKVSLLDLVEDVGDILDIGIYYDGIYILARKNGFYAPVLIHEDREEQVDYFSRLDIVSCSFLATESMCVRVRYRYPEADRLSDIIWCGGQEWRHLMRGGLVTSMFNDANGCHAVVYSSADQEGMILSFDRRYRIVPGYHAYGEECITARDSVVYVGLTSSTGGKPVIWRNGILDTLNINGPLTCLR